MSDISMDDLLKEAKSDLKILEKAAGLISTATIAATINDVLTNSVRDDLNFAIGLLSIRGPKFNAALKTLMALSFEMGRLYGRSELMEELEPKG